MPKIQVTIRKDQGDLGIHPIYGRLEPGGKIEIEEEHFGDQLFERPSPDWLSPQEKRDKERAQELQMDVGGQKYEPPANSPPQSPLIKGDVSKASAPDKGESEGIKEGGDQQ